MTKKEFKEWAKDKAIFKDEKIVDLNIWFDRERNIWFCHCITVSIRHVAYKLCFYKELNGEINFLHCIDTM